MKTKPTAFQMSYFGLYLLSMFTLILIHFYFKLSNYINPRPKQIHIVPRRVIRYKAHR